MNYNLPQKTKIIELDSASYLVVKVTKHHILGQVVGITQYYKKDGKIKETEPLNIPINDNGLSAIQNLEEFFESFMSKRDSSSKFENWLKEDVKEKRLTEFRQKLEHFSEKKPKEVVEQEISQERLRELIPNSPFIVEDVVYAIINNQRFAEKVKISLDQMRPIMFHGLMGGRNLITTKVSEFLLKLNIDYDYLKTGKVLLEFAEAGFLNYKDGVSKNNQKYRVWLFSEQKNGLE